MSDASFGANDLDSRMAPEPALILCQSASGSCAACCGAYNFADNTPDAMHARFERRTTAVAAAGWDEAALSGARDALLAAERPHFLFGGLKVCPFAGYVEPGRVGCMIHPLRHPTGADLRDLAVYPREVCAGHFCASHDWLRPREQAFAQTCTGPRYGQVIADPGLVKALCAWLERDRGRALVPAAFAAARAATDALWDLLFAWPYRDPNPRRFGAFVATGDDAIERTVPSAFFGIDVAADREERAIVDALGTVFKDAAQAAEALGVLRAQLEAVSAAL